MVMIFTCYLRTLYDDVNKIPLKYILRQLYTFDVDKGHQHD